MIFEIDLDLGDLNSAIDALSIAIGERQEVLLAAIGETLFNRNTARHAQGLGPDGTPWKPLAPSTLGTIIWNKQAKEFRKGNSRRGAVHSLATARKIIGSRRPLWDTGEMLTNHFHPQVIGDTLHLGFDLDRAKWHHAGTDPYQITPKKAQALSFGGVTVKRVNHPGLPARPLVGFPEDDRTAVGEDVEDYLVAALRQRRQR